jgi:hypothetical protein
MDLQYGGDTFVTACKLLERHRSSSGSARLLPRKGDAAGLKAMVALLWGLPRVRVRVSRSPAGERIRRYLAYRKWGLVPDTRIAQGFLAVPPTIDEYLGGRHRQALRTNLNRAQSRGIKVVPLTGVEERRWAVARWAENCPTRTQEDIEWLRSYWEVESDRPGRRWLAALDRSGDCVGVCVVTVDVECALLEHLVATSPARWSLNAAVVEMLCEEGISYLFVTPVNGVRAERNVQYLHRLLGYSIAHIVVRREGRGARALPRVSPA